MKRLPPHADLPAEADTIRFGESLATQARAGDVVCLYGPLGAGKSVLARAFVRALCGPKTDVPSPTFTLMQGYDAPEFEIIHADLYRLENPHEIIEIGLEERLDDAVVLIEWPQRMGNFIPGVRLDLILTIHTRGHRTADLIAHGPIWENRLARD